MFNFRRITLFCLEKCFSKLKMTMCSENLEGAVAPLASPGYAYGCEGKRRLIRVDAAV